MEIVSRLRDCCNIDIVGEIETSQTELAQEFANYMFPLPLPLAHWTSIQKSWVQFYERESIDPK